MEALLASFVALAQQVGAPVALGIAFIWAIEFSGRYVSRATYEALMNDRDFREEMRVEERKGRLDSEERLAALTGAIATLTDVLHEVERDVLRDQRH